VVIRDDGLETKAEVVVDKGRGDNKSRLKAKIEVVVDEGSGGVFEEVAAREREKAEVSTLETTAARVVVT
jgi:hypothetical protein